MDSPSTATVTARSLVDGLVAAGVQEVVLCPGSRSAPLAYAVHAADAAGLLRLHVRIDERSAGFTALGMGRVTGRPAVLVTTSGTAVANLMPAVLEAHHAGVPMLVMSADRPERLRGTWANQTSDLQPGLFGPAVRWSRDVTAAAGPAWGSLVAEAVAAATSPAGPVHLNVGFDDPLVPPDLSWRPAAAPGRPASPGPTAPPPLAHALPQLLPLGARTVVVAGDGAGPDARALAEAAGWPLLAEPTSGSRGGPCRISGYRLLLNGPLGRAVERVVVFGRPTLSRPVTQLLARPDLVLVVVGRGAHLAGAPGRAAQSVPGRVGVDSREDGGWLDAWRHAGREAAEAIEAVLGESRAADGLAGYDVAREVTAATGPDVGLVLAASNPIRDVDLAAGDVAARFAIANRGLSGIDGTVSTAVGASLAMGPVRVLVGDLALLHDSNALLLGPGEPAPALQVVVVNDGGGGIFGLLEHGEDRFAAAYERVFGTPQRVDLQALCAAHGVRQTTVSDITGLSRALATSPSPGIEVVEVPVRRDRERKLAERLAAAVAR